MPHNGVVLLELLHLWPDEDRDLRREIALRRRRLKERLRKSYASPRVLIHVRVEIVCSAHNVRVLASGFAVVHVIVGECVAFG